MVENKTNIGLQFFKGVYGKAAALAKSNETTGAIVFDETTKNIYVDGTIYGGASDVSYANGVLTFSFTDGRHPITLDFTDTASAGETLKVFKHLNDIVGDNFDAINEGSALDYSGTNYIKDSTTLVGADRVLDAQIKAVDTRIDNLDVTSNTVNGTNVHVKYKQVDGKVTIESVTEDYATVTATEYKKAEGEQALVNPALVVKDGDNGKLLKAGDVATIAKYTDDKVKQLKDEVNSQVDGLNVNDYAQATYDGTGNIVIKGIQENKGLISETDDAEKNLTINVNHGYSKEDTNLTYLATAGTVKGAIESLYKTTTAAAHAENQTHTNINFNYEETDGIVTINGLDEKYATTTVTTAQEATDTIFTTTNGTQLATGSDVQKAADFTNTRIGEEIAKLDVGSQVLFTYGKNADDSEDKTHIVITTGISETDGKIAVAGAENLYFKSAVTEGNRLVTESEIKNMLGALVYRGTITEVGGLPSGDDVKNGDVYVAANAFNGGTYGSIEAGDMFIYTKGTEEGATGKWQVISGENQVTNEDATIIAGAVTTTKIATVDGTDITVGVHVTAGSATIATLANDVVTIKPGVKQGENTGTIEQDTTVADIVLAKVAHTGKAEDVSVEDTEGVITATDVEGALVEIAKEIDAMDADYTATEGGADNRAKDAKANVAVSLKEEDGKVTSLGVDVTYATIASKKDDGEDTELTGTDGTGLLIGTDVATLVTFTNTRIAEEVAKLDATVTNDEGETQTETVKTTIVETDGKLTSVSSIVLGASVVYTPAQAATEEEEAKEANLAATKTAGAILGSDVTAIKNYIDAKAAKGTTTVTNSLESADAIVLTETTADDGHKNYDVKLVWSEWSNQ